MIDLKMFPPELNLFECEASWRLSSKIANCNGADEGALNEAEIILRIQGYERRDYYREALENYFLLGDESVFDMARPIEAPVPPSVVAEEEVIMPTVTRPPDRERMPLIPPIGVTPTTRELLTFLYIAGVEHLIPPSAEVPATQEPVSTPIIRPVSPPRVEPPKIKAAVPEEELHLLDHVEELIRSRGFHYPDWLLKSYYVCFKSEPLVLLVGYSGTGRTSLARLFAEVVAMDFAEQYERITAHADWDGRGFLGFYDLNKGTYISTPFLEFLLKASKNKDRPYFLCLDDMTPSQAEAVLSRLVDAWKSPEGELQLHGINDGAKTAEGNLIPSKIRRPDNLFVTGIVTVEEPVYQLEGRLSDLVNVIEFLNVDLKQWPERHAYEKTVSVDMETLKRFKRAPTGEEVSSVVEVLDAINTAVEGLNLVSYRIREDVLSYVANSRDIFSTNPEENLIKALDIQIRQRICTKIDPSRSKRRLLEQLLGYLEARFPLSAEKVRRTLERLDEARVQPSIDFNARYMFTVNGQPLTPLRSNTVRFGSDNVFVLRSVRGGHLKAELYVDSIGIADRGRLYEEPEAVVWRWRPEKVVKRASLRLKMDDDSVYDFEVSASS